MNIESAFTVLRREQLLIDHSPHSVQFENLTERLLWAFSADAVIPPLTAEEIQLYAALALLHDVGKRAIPQEILNKELRKCEAFPAICDVCRHHHERWDGNGYPDRLAGDSITPWVQVVGLADAFDALIHPRVYKPAYPQEQARDMIDSGACGVFHPLLLACFNRNIGEIAQTVYA